MRNVIEYQVVHHGQEEASHFQGCGVSLTRFDECYTGAGDTPGDALRDAIDQAMLSGNCDFTSEHASEIEFDWLGDPVWADARGLEHEGEWHWYVSLRVRFAPDSK